MDHVVVESDGARLTVRVSKQDGPPILLLHGGPGVPDSMQTTIAPLLADMRCISFDQRGVGASTCTDGRYDLDAYLTDIEAIRDQFGVDRWHVLGHSWGGLLAQSYANDHADHVRSLVLSSSSLGVGTDWKSTKRAAFATDRHRAGLRGTARFVTFAAGLALPGRARSRAMRRVITETWHNYFLDPTSAPDPDLAWLDGCSVEAMLATDRAISRTDRRRLDRLAGLDVPVLVLYGEYDIFGDATHIVRDRFPHARQVTLSGSGHLHWLQQADAYSDELRGFYQQVEQPLTTGSRSEQWTASLEQRVAPAAIETAGALADPDHREAARLV